MKLLTLSIMLAATISAAAQQKQNFNLPIIQTKYTADPAPYVHGDTVYLYTTHDEDDAEGFKMKDWLLYTSTDMVNWQDTGRWLHSRISLGIRETTEHGQNR